MKDLTPQQEAAIFTAQQIADNTTGASKIFYQEVIKEIEKL
jgi:hypothetical protein